MSSRWFFAALVAALTATAARPQPAPSASAEKRAIETGPAVGWTLPIFSDREGFRLLTLRGDTARFRNANHIDVSGFSAVVFSGDASERVDTVLLSPAASFFPRDNRAAGESSVRLVHDDVEVVGRGWSYDHRAKKVSLANDVRVTFRAQLNDILK